MTIRSHTPAAQDDHVQPVAFVPPTPPAPQVAALQTPTQDIQLSDMEKTAIRETVNGWLADINSHAQLEAGSRHRLTLTITPEARFVSDRGFSEKVEK